MANFIKNPFFFITINLFLVSFLPIICSLSTLSISKVFNKTLVCALIQSSPQQSSLNCTSFPEGIQIPVVSPFAESFTSVVGGDGFVCALGSYLSSTSFIVCWRFLADDGTEMSYKRIYLGHVIDELDAGNSHVCGLINGATHPLRCWQWPEFDLNSWESSSLITSSLAVGEDFLCGLVESGGQILQCLPKGKGTNNVSDHVPGGEYSLVAAGARHACAISFSGNLECWGDYMSGGGFNFKPTSEKFKSLALGENSSCGMRLNGTVICWGENNTIINNLPVSLQRASFISLEAKRDVFCGVLTSNFSLYCWGNNLLNSNSPVFNNVVPSPCRKRCPCDPLPNYANYCSQGLMMCEPCIREQIPPFIPPLPILPPPPILKAEKSASHWNKKTVAFLLVGCFGCLSFIIVVSFLVFKYSKRRVHNSGPLEEVVIALNVNNNNNNNKQYSGPVLEKRLSQLLSSGPQGSKLLSEFTIEDLLQATNNFSEERRIGKGSFGTVYYGILADGSEVAIKRAEFSCNTNCTTKRNQEDKDIAFLNELELLSFLNHKNLVRLLGFCDSHNERVLVYEYMDNGTLHDHLHSCPLMSWTARIKVALDTARGIEYLHEYAVPPIIHRDVKSSNILLDSTWNAKVSDFGLSQMRPQDDDESSSSSPPVLQQHAAAGTVGYMDPEYYRLQQLTTKSDVYSFGVVLLELLSGRKAIHKNENGIPRNVVDYVVPYIVQDEIHRVLDSRVPPPTPYEIEAVTYVGYLAADCVTFESKDRPNMSEVVNSLERALVACLKPLTLSTSSTESSI